MRNVDLQAREREDLSRHVKGHGAEQSSLGKLRQQMRRIETAIWAMAALLLASGAGSAKVLSMLLGLGGRSLGQRTDAEPPLCRKLGSSDLGSVRDDAICDRHGLT